jgi:hypothetical protein
MGDHQMLQQRLGFAHALHAAHLPVCFVQPTNKGLILF